MSSNGRSNRIEQLFRAIKFGRQAYSAQRNGRRIGLWAVGILAAVLVLAGACGGDDDDDDDDDESMGSYSVSQLAG